MKFKYFKFNLPEKHNFFGRSVLKPIIPIEMFASPDNVFKYAALVDSGADFCIFEAGIGQALGLKVEDGEPINFGGIQEAGLAKAYLHEITIIVGGWKYKILAGFSHNIAKDGYDIVGQKGFFDIFKIHFDLLKEEIELKERK